MQIYICGIGMTPFGHHGDKNIKQLTEMAVNKALQDASCKSADIQAAFYSSSTTSYMQGQNFIPGQIALRSMGFEDIPIFNIENACASGSSTMHLAQLGLRAGEYDVALAVGVEKMIIENRARMFGVFDSGWDIETPEQNQRNLLALGDDCAIPPNTTSDKPYSVFMDVYAAFGRQHIHRFGTTQRQIAAISAKNHQHSVHNPNAQFQRPYTVDEILASPPITYPLTLPMCAPISDGAAAVILCNEQGLKRLNSAHKRAVRLLGSVVQTGINRAADDHANHLSVIAAQKLYEKTGIDPDDISLAEVHDATAVGELIQVENLQLIPFGEGGAAAERGDFTIGGRVPVNTSGGLESRGHPISATGLAQVCELVIQLRGEAGARQVENARIAVQENGGGLYGYEEAVAVLNAFEAPSNQFRTK